MRSPAGLVWDCYAIFSDLFREIFNGGDHKPGLDKMAKLGNYDDVNHVEAACTPWSTTCFAMTSHDVITV